MDFIEPLNNVKTVKSKYHSIEQHNFWIKRNKCCPYCNSGSTPVHKTIVIAELNKFNKKGDMML